LPHFNHLPKMMGWMLLREYWAVFLKTFLGVESGMIFFLYFEDVNWLKDYDLQGGISIQVQVWICDEGQKGVSWPEGIAPISNLRLQSWKRI
jgi:ABC-type polysaccharide transport system permease subunit